MKSGIYQIVNKSNGKFYIGSSEDLDRRKKTHFYLLKKKKHNNQHLQASYNLDANAFEFFVIEYCNSENLLMIEQSWLDVVFDGGKRCYNLALNVEAPMKNKKHKQESKNRVGDKNRGRKASEETKRKMRESAKTRIKNPNAGAKISAAKLGKKRKPFTEAARKNMSLCKIGKKQSAETIEKRRMISSTKRHSKETKEKIRQNSLNMSIETKRKMSESAKKRWAKKKEVI